MNADPPIRIIVVFPTIQLSQSCGPESPKTGFEYCKLDQTRVWAFTRPTVVICA